MLRAAASLAIAAVGGGVSLLLAALTGHLDDTTTVREVVTPPAAPAAFSAPRGLSVEQIYRSDASGVVEVTATEQALGSGFVIDKAGHIVTNEHVIAGAPNVQVSFSGASHIGAKVVGLDPSTDVAVLQIDAHSRSLTPLPLGDSDTVEVGDPVVAIGNQLSLTRTATAGIVSAVERTIDEPDGLTVGHAIQTDAAINHGNSGGPLIDGNGEVIGVNAQSTAAGSLGIGLAIPINTVKTVVAQLIRNGSVRHVYLGVGAQPISPSLARLFNLPVSHGLLVDVVTPGSAAALAGLRAGTTPVLVHGESYALGGDIIVSVDGTSVATQAQLRELLTQHEPGDRLTLALYRAGRRLAVPVTLGRPPG